MAWGERFVKCTFVFYLLLLGAASLATIVLTTWLLIDILGYSHFLSPDAASGPVIASLLAGLVYLPALVLCGFLAFFRKHQNLATLFMVGLCVGGILSISLSVWSLVLRSHLRDHLEVDMTLAVTPPDQNDFEKTQWDHVQRTLECCGVHGAGDYTSTGSLPMSCCSVVERACAQTHTRGCLVALSDYGATKLVEIALFGAVLALLLFGGVYSGCSLSNLLQKSPAAKNTLIHQEEIPLAPPRKIYLKDVYK